MAALTAARASACEAALAAAPPAGFEKGVRERERERERSRNQRERELGFVLSQEEGGEGFRGGFRIIRGLDSDFRTRIERIRT